EVRPRTIEPPRGSPPGVADELGTPSRGPPAADSSQAASTCPTRETSEAPRYPRNHAVSPAVVKVDRSGESFDLLGDGLIGTDLDLGERHAEHVRAIDAGPDSDAPGQLIGGVPGRARFGGHEGLQGLAGLERAEVLAHDGPFAVSGQGEEPDCRALGRGDI